MRGERVESAPLFPQTLLSNAKARASIAAATRDAKEDAAHKCPSSPHPGEEGVSHFYSFGPKNFPKSSR